MPHPDKYQPYKPGEPVPGKYQHRFNKTVTKLEKEGDCTSLLIKLWNESAQEKPNPKETWPWFVMKLENVKFEERNGGLGI